MNTCPFCKGQIGDGTIICSKCGKDITSFQPSLTKTSIILRSTNNTLEFRTAENSLIVRYYGFVNQFGKTTEIPLNQIVSVSIVREPSGTFSPGIIEIKIAGGPDEIIYLTSSLSVGTGNRIKLIYDISYQKVAWDLKQYIIDYQSNSAVKAQTAVNNPADEIRKYKELLDIGAITQDEFEQKKKQLLGL